MQPAGLRRNDDQRWNHRRRSVVLEAEGLHDRRLVLPGNALQMKSVAIDHAAAAKREDLNRGTLALDREPQYVHTPLAGKVGCLPLEQVLHRREPVSIPGRLLELLLVGRLLHRALQAALNRIGVAGKELDHRVDQDTVVGGRDQPDAGRIAAIDVVIEARNARAPAWLRPFAGTETEDPVQHVERAAHLLGVRVRTEVEDAAAVALTGEHDARKLVLDGHSHVRKGLVVAQADVEGRTPALDQVLLEVQRLDLVAGRDRLDLGHPLDQLGNAGAPVAAGAEVAAHARAQRFRLADVENAPLLVVEEVDAGCGRKRPQLLAERSGHAAASVVEPQ